MMDAAERVLLEETVGLALADEGTAADAALADLGWLEMLEAEPRDAVDIVFNALGTTNRAATALDDVVASALGTTPRADLAVLLPGFGTWHAPGRVEAGDVRAVGLATARVLTARELLVVCVSGSGVTAVAVPASSAQLRAVQGIDADMGLHRVRIDHAETSGTRLDPAAWESAVALARRAVAHQLAGASRTMLALACTHALEREQFGRRIASFQAVRHRLAEALVAVEALEATLSAAGDEPSSTLPAGTGRDRFHDRPSVPPISQAHDGARRTLRLGRRHRTRHRKTAHRRAPGSDPGRALTSTRIT
jgi:Acyl-CoA dehydrogenase, C-terminal domain